jgi:hypothetical protein
MAALNKFEVPMNFTVYGVFKVAEACNGTRYTRTEDYLFFKAFTSAQKIHLYRLLRRGRMFGRRFMAQGIIFLADASLAAVFFGSS